jgi:DNA-directed RNA polymerase specialized sigma24 family protein
MERKLNLDALSRSEIEKLIDEWILNERDRKILKRRLIDGICYEPLAEEFELSVRHVKKIVYKAEEKLTKITHK